MIEHQCYIHPDDLVLFWIHAGFSPVFLTDYSKVEGLGGGVVKYRVCRQGDGVDRGYIL